MCHGMIRWALPEILSGAALIPAPFETVDLTEQHLRVDDAAGAENAHLAGENPGRQLAELERLAVDDHRVAGIRPTLVAADDVRLLREQVDDLAFPLVAPLRTDDDGGRHDGSVPDPGGWRGWGGGGGRGGRQLARTLLERARRWARGWRARRGSRGPAGR